MTDQDLRPLDRNISILILCIVICSVGLLSFFTYSESASILVGRDSILRHHAESTLIESYTRFSEQSLSISDDVLTDRLGAVVPSLLEEYERAGRDPAQMDLSAFLWELGPGYEVRVIDTEGETVAVTGRPADGAGLMPPASLHIAPGATPPDEGFTALPMTSDPSTDNFRKRVSVWTPDLRYQIEVERVDDWFGFRSEQVQAEIADVMNTDPAVRSVRIFNLTKYEADVPVPASDAVLDSRLDRVIAARTTMEFANETGSIVHRFIFLDLSATTGSSTDPSVVIELVYSTQALEDALLRLKIEHAGMAFLVIVLAVLLTIYLSSRMTQPIRRMIEDVETIAAGDLNHPIRLIALTEFDSLRQSILRMVEGLRLQTDLLEHRVEERTQQLVEANEEAHLFLDIMTHDINNSLAVALSSCEYLAETLSDAERERAARVAAAIRQGSGIIERVAWARSLKDQEAALEPVSLDTEIRRVLATTTDVGVDYSGTDVEVMADRVLPEVFINLVGNSRKFGGPDVRCEITVEAADDTVTVTFADNGPGIPDPDKERVFNRFVRGSSPGAGSGLGLWIVFTLIHRYGGRIWIENRVPGEPDMGVAIRFTLRRSW